ncbi:hypothetical protein SAMN02745220_01609 [Desulfopila aestuarii DSM 18488]|uniref:Uncharacterized protein n=1 Tax=Desulfopila aestuarii DSM 18488 TaxID=1121416 RepID=A0A1M7Y3F3_9BACT|nr:hypothetical protein SAMN02745220_01609 [Desulfopila aestuarii DSM 18488]
MLHKPIVIRLYVSDDDEDRGVVMVLRMAGMLETKWSNMIYLKKTGC